MNARFLFLSLLCIGCFQVSGASPSAANRYTVLDEFTDIYYPSRDYPKLTTPQWVGEEGVEAVLVLAIDDMRDHRPYEAYLRPILERLKQIDGRAPVSIMSCKIDPNEPHLQTWLQEGVSLEAHTIDHPCPILDKSNFAAAKSTYDRCIDLFATVPNSRPVAFRTPCMDGINSASPRLFAEIMMGETERGNFLSISSSIGLVLTADDPENPKQLVLDSEGKPRFKKYLPPGYINYIENYPYPYLIGNKIWEAPFCVPDDYEASRVFGDKSPNTVEDMKASIDAIVAKKGIWVMTFHPYQWFGNTQIIELIDYVVSRHGRKAKFLNLREVNERLEKNPLGGQPLRAKDGSENGVRLLDLNDDGYLDVVVANEEVRRTRIWDSEGGRWSETEFPALVKGGTVRFGVVDERPCAFGGEGFWAFEGGKWIAKREWLSGLELDGRGIQPVEHERDQGVRLRDINANGNCEIIVSNSRQNAVFEWSATDRMWKKLAFSLPAGVSIVTETAADNGVRFFDFNRDGIDDLIFSNEAAYGLWLGVPEVVLGFKQGWSREIVKGKRGDQPEIPMISRGGDHPNNGAWFSRGMMWVQNEDTAKLPDLVDRVSINDLLNGFQPPPKGPEEALKTMEIDRAFAIELAAHEPAVQDPVALEWAADGTLWVVEMRDYPRGVKGKVGGVIKRLRDDDGDGVYENWSIFLDGLNYPTGVMPWKNGLLVSAAPEILYVEDSEGDGKADRKEVLFRGFVEGNQQHRVNGFELGLDNWIHGANGDSGGQIESLKTGTKTSIRGRDFRFQPDTGAFATASGQTQFGKRRDDWGNWFGGANYSWGWHYVLPEDYLARNPRLPVRSTYRPLNPQGTRVFPASRVQQRFNDIGMAGHVTSACSFAPYRDELFGEEFERSIFICEPTHNLVHREVLEHEGVSFRSRRAPSENDREFLASSDPWFRPTFVKTGPDGAIYIADMYRLVIEHPEWIPRDVQERIDVRSGDDKGRIYRIHPKNTPHHKFDPLHKLPPQELAQAMNSPNGWQRDTVQRLLLQSKPAEATPILKELAAHNSSPKVRLQSLCTLAAIEETIPEDVLIRALRDSHPVVRAHAVRLFEPRLSKAPAGLIESLASDMDIRVRYQAALSAGQCSPAAAVPALIRIAARDADNADMITAVAISSSRFSRELLVALIDSSARGSQIERLLDHLVKATAETSNSEALAEIARELEPCIRDRNAPAWKLAALAPLLKSNGPLLAQLQERARATLADAALSESDRLAVLPLAGDDIQLLGSLISPANPPKIQSAAIHRLGQIDHPEVSDVLLRGWRGSSLQTRNEILAILLKRESWTSLLLDRLEAGEFDASARQALLNHPAERIRSAARQVFQPSQTDRDDVVKRLLASVSKLAGDPVRGKDFFNTHCATCHKFGEAGSGAGPNLAMLRDHSLETILVAILDPNRAVEDRYRNYNLELKNGEQPSGIMLNESANSVTLMGITGIEQTVLRREIVSLHASQLSIMPEGFEQFLEPQDFADLVVFLRQR